MKKYIFLTLAALAIYFVGVFSGVGVMLSIRQDLPVQVVSYPTGYEIFDEVNAYRRSMGKPDLVLWDALCNNIAERKDVYQHTNSHDGLNEFAQKYMPNVPISEVLTYSTSAAEAVKNWQGSPSHNIKLLSKSRACAYSSQGYSVMLLSD